MEKSPVRVIQISDLHVFGDKQKSLLGVKTYDSFNEVISLLKKEKPIDAIVVTGDISQDDTDTSYAIVAELLKPFSVPIYIIPGNHDNQKTMDATLAHPPFKKDKHVLLNDWQIILLNSQKPGKVEGRLAENQLMFLKKCLTDYPHHRGIVVFHHQPIPVGSKWLDNLGIENAAELWDCLQAFPNMHTILFGHVHQEHMGEKNGIQYYSPPSTCIQFKCKSDEFKLDKLPPGYRLIELYPEGKLKTAVVRLDHYVGDFDANAKGY